MRSVPDPAGGTQLMVDPNGIHTLEQFVLAKYYLTTQVIRHHVRLITDQMLLRAIYLGIDQDQIEELKDIYTFDGSLEFIRRYSQWNDLKVRQRFGSDCFRGKHCYPLFDGLLRRRLLKRVYNVRLGELTVGAREALKEISKHQNRAKRQELETKLAESIDRTVGLIKYECLDSSEFVILHSYTFKSVKEQSRNDESSI
jgi:HD superfamily phosphohydrolase